MHAKRVLTRKLHTSTYCTVHVHSVNTNKCESSYNSWQFNFWNFCQNKKWSCMCEDQVSENRFSPENHLCCARQAQASWVLHPPIPRPTYDEGVKLRCQSRQSQQKLKKQWKLPTGTKAWVFLAFSYLEKSKRGWAARAWTRTASRTPGRGSPEHSLPSTSPPPSEAGWSAAKSVSASATSSSKNLKK